MTRSWLARHHVAMGFTGKWQLERTPGATTVEELIWLDQSYLAEWSLQGDLCLLGRTLLAIVRRTGR